jgi:predicted transcriptional regulator
LCDIKFWGIWKPQEGNNMTSKKRTNDQIFSEILKLCVKGTNKTRIIYQANLNSVVVKSHLDNLMKNGFIESVRYGSRIREVSNRDERSLCLCVTSHKC